MPISDEQFNKLRPVVDEIVDAAKAPLQADITRLEQELATAKARIAELEGSTPPDPDPDPGPEPEEPTPTPGVYEIRSLTGTVPPTFTVRVDVPADTASVRYYLDTAYLGMSQSAPHQWQVSNITAGSHEFEVRIRNTAGATVAKYEQDFTVSGTAPTPPTPTNPNPVPVPTEPPAPAPDGSIHVTNAEQLQAALTAAQPGQTIVIEDGTYLGKFKATPSGTENSRIRLTGSRNAIIRAGGPSSGYGLHVTGAYWSLDGFRVTDSAKGIVMDAAPYTYIDNVEVDNVGDEAVHFRKNSHSGRITGSDIHDTGKRQPRYGEGVYIGTAISNWSTIMGSSTTPDKSDNVTVAGNHIWNTTTEGVDVKEGTTGGRIVNNRFDNAGYSGENFGDSWVDVKGNNYLIADNVGNGTLLDAFQVHVPKGGWGNNNVFDNNTIEGGVPGYEVSVQSGAQGTVIYCKDTIAGKGLTNITCTPK